MKQNHGEVAIGREKDGVVVVAVPQPWICLHSPPCCVRGAGPDDRRPRQREGGALELATCLPLSVIYESFIAVMMGTSTKIS